MRQRHRLSPTTVIACLALFFAVAGGTAIALQGRNTVDSGDIKPKNVKASDLANNAVNSRKIRNGQVKPADIGRQEAYHRPQLSIGNEGDCVWANVPGTPIGLDPAAFYKDAMGRVHLTGILFSADAAGGDGACGPSASAEGIEDATAFILPPAYRPANDEARISSTGTLLIVGTTPIPTMSGPIPAGAVLDLSAAGQVVLEGVSYRANGTGSGLTRRDPVARGDLPRDLADLAASLEPPAP